jgi:ABC-type transport system involved in multi-copper enzyme maturation permease subunit
MLSLIWKDFYINRVQFLTPAIMFGGIMLLSLVMDSSTALVYAVPLMFAYSGLIVPFFALNSAMLEEKNRTLAFLRSLPMSADAIVASKFIAPLLAGVIWATFAALGAAFMGPRMGDNAPSIVSGLLLVCATLPIAAIELVVFFRFGTNAARTALLVVWAVVFFVPMAGQGFSAKVEPVTRMVLSPSLSSVALLAGCALLVYFAGMLIAQAIFRRQEI